MPGPLKKGSYHEYDVTFNLGQHTSYAIFTLALVGCDGDDGAPGPQGEQGEQGEQGPPGGSGGLPTVDGSGSHQCRDHQRYGGEPTGRGIHADR